MKTLLHYLKTATSCIIILMSSAIFSQEGINYQGVAMDVNSELLTNANITLDINVVKTSIAGTVVYSETHNIMTDINGVFSTVIGNGVPSFNLFSDINWAEDKHFLNVWLDGVEVGTSEFVNVPYASAMGKWQAHKNGVTAKGTGGSIYVGDNAGISDDFTDNRNIGIGDNALFNAESGTNNIALGYQSLFTNATGDRNIANGYQALYSNRDGHDNLAIGYKTLYNNTLGNDNIANGLFSLYHNTIGNNNIGLGVFALRYNVNGSNNVGIGYKPLHDNIDGTYNIAFGYEALFANTSGSHNIAVGYDAMYNNILGDRNIALGKDALYSNVTGPSNIAIGYESQHKNESGHSNVAIGGQTLKNNTTAEENVAIGFAAGFSALGRSNVFVGNQAGYNEVGSNKLYINNDNATFPLIYGDFNTDVLGFNAKVGIGTKTPQLPLQVTTGIDANLSNGSGQVIIGTEGAANLVMDNNEIQARNNGAAADLYLQTEGGNVRVGGAVVHASDRRLKRDIEDISYGLKEILQLEAKEYFWKGKTQDHKSLGLIAQDVNEIIKNVVTYNLEEDKYGVSYTELIPVLIKAIQEQEAIIKTLKQDVAELKAIVNSKL
jgi:hypothetical protein